MGKMNIRNKPNYKDRAVLSFPCFVFFQYPKVNLDLIFPIRICKKYYRNLKKCSFVS